MDTAIERKVVQVLRGETYPQPPIWLMRQAGRYLPEYRELRAKAGGFLKMCYTPEYAVEITMQPIRRFGFDAAILFSDILVIPDALGQKVRFEEGRGPVLEQFDSGIVDRAETGKALEYLDPVIQAVSGVRSELPGETTLLGFCGAPWTVATYMIAGHGTTDQAPARLFGHQFPDRFAALIELLADISADYLIAQLDAGADAVQIFDSWAGVLGEEEFGRWSQEPIRRMIDRIRKKHPKAPVIAFAKGAGLHLAGFRKHTAANALGLDWTIPMEFARKLQDEGPVQGMLDPTRLVAGGAALDRGIDAILENLGSGPLVFNLGHGITPDTPIDHVEQLISRVRNHPNV